MIINQRGAARDCAPWPDWPHTPQRTKRSARHTQSQCVTHSTLLTVTAHCVTGRPTVLSSRSHGRASSSHTHTATLVSGSDPGSDPSLLCWAFAFVLNDEWTVAPALQAHTRLVAVRVAVQRSRGGRDREGVEARLQRTLDVVAHHLLGASHGPTRIGLDRHAVDRQLVRADKAAQLVERQRADCVAAH